MDEEGAKKAKKESDRALKRKKRPKVSILIEVISSKRTQNTKLLEYQTTKAARKAIERYGEVGPSSFGIIAKLIEVDITSKSGSESLKAFKAFVGAIFLSLSFFKIHMFNNWLFFGLPHLWEAEHLYDITKVSMEKAMRQTIISNESYKKQQKYIAALEERETCLTNEVAELLK